MMEPFVTPEWLADHFGEVVVVHVATTMGTADPLAQFERRRIEGAVNVSLERVLSDPPAPIVGRHPLPSPERFADEMGRIGIGDRARVVAYDDGNGAFAARLVWMLRIIGQDAALLDGGFAGRPDGELTSGRGGGADSSPGDWTGPTESGPVRTALTPVARTTVPWPAQALADADAVVAQIADGGVVIDSRAAARYRGDTEPIDAVAGHIPGAINLDVADTLDARRRLLSADLLRERFARLPDDDASIVYCGSGVTACLNALAIESTGLPRPRVYVGSWSGWSSDPDRPIATGD